jgi:predicted dehydrogenase
MELVAVADLLLARREAALRAHPLAVVRGGPDAIIDDATVDLVVIATPPATHHDLAARALRAGKHVLVEKPLVTDPKHGYELARLASESKRHLFVDHTFLFTGAVRKILAYADELGELLYYDAIRTNLGTFQSDTDVLWDLAPHDLSILLSLVRRPPASVSAVGARHGPGDRESMAYLTVRFAGGPLAHIHVNWLSPAKVRRTIVGGARRMLIYDDIEASEKLKVYESPSTSEMDPADDVLRRLVDYRVGDVIAPRLDQTEALRFEIVHIARVLLDGELPISDVALGLRVVEVIDAAHRSIALEGTPVPLEA